MTEPTSQDVVGNEFPPPPEIDDYNEVNSEKSNQTCDPTNLLSEEIRNLRQDISKQREGNEACLQVVMSELSTISGSLKELCNTLQSAIKTLEPQKETEATKPDCNNCKQSERHASNPTINIYGSKQPVKIVVSINRADSERTLIPIQTIRPKTCCCYRMCKKTGNAIVLVLNKVESCSHINR